MCLHTAGSYLHFAITADQVLKKIGSASFSLRFILSIASDNDEHIDTKNANFKQKTQITYTLSLLSESIFTPIARRARSNGNP